MVKRLVCKTVLLAMLVAGLELGGSVPEIRAQSQKSNLPADSLTVDNSLSLTALEHWVQKRNPDIEAARQAVIAASAVQRQAGSIPDPTSGPSARALSRSTDLIHLCRATIPFSRTVRFHLKPVHRDSR